jgi:hypothetical protein
MLLLRLLTGFPSRDETIANQETVVCMACSELHLMGACVLQPSSLQMLDDLSQSTSAKK